MPDFAQPVLGHAIGYADFVAALAGAVAARRPSRQTAVAVATTAFAGAVRAVDGRRAAAVLVPVTGALLAATVAAQWRARARVAPAIPT